MNKTLINVLFVVFGFLAHLLLYTSPEWSIVGIIGMIVAAAGLTNISVKLFKLTSTKADYIVPALAAIILGAGLYFLRLNNYYDLTGLSRSLAETTSILLVFFPVVRLYLAARVNLNF